MLHLGKRRPGIWTNTAAGLAGGLAASWAMGLFHHFLSKVSNTTNEHEGGQDATVQAASAISEGVFKSGYPQTKDRSADAIVHFAFGSGMGALYCAVASMALPASAGAGAAFGAAVWAGAHVVAVPAFGLSKRPLEKALAGEAIELASHLVYGAVTDGVRRTILRAAGS